MSHGRQLALAAILLLLTLLLFETSGLDLWLQDFFYRTDSHRWLIHKDDPIPRLIFYTGAKRIIILFGVLTLIAFGLSFKRSALVPYRQRLLMVTLSVILVPAIVAGSKNITNVHCPWATDRYGGDQPYVKVLERYPPGDYTRRTGKCFPAGHPTGGFALMSLFFVFTSPAARRRGLALGLAMGWIMGIFQMLKGAHFLSHVIFSMIASWMVILGVYELVHRRLAHLFPHSPPPTLPGMEKKGVTK